MITHQLLQVLEDVDKGVDVRLTGEVEACPHVSLRTDDSLGETRIQSMDYVCLLIHNGVVEVRLDLA